MVPSGFFTSTLTAPAAWAGVVAFNWVELTKETPEAAVPPNAMVAPLAKLVPAMVTAVPPVVGPELGEMLLMAGEDEV